jgi:hypothetical protein
MTDGSRRLLSNWGGEITRPQGCRRFQEWRGLSCASAGRLMLSLWYAKAYGVP